MSWEIDRFQVKPTGFLASWRQRRVLVDENGTVTSDCVPGKECMNLPCISDYNKKDRRYANDALITTYCNTITHQLFKVFAQDCAPFAYVQTTNDAPECGYMTPLPTPAVPPNPWGTASYGLNYFFQYCDENYVPVRVNIYRKSYVGDVIELRDGGQTPVLLSYNQSGSDDKFTKFRALEATLIFIANTDFALKDLYENDQREFKIEIIKNDELRFMGWAIPDSCSEPFIAPGYPVSIRATDSIGDLQEITYPLPVGSSLDIRQSFLDIVAYCLSQTNLNLDIQTVCNLYERKNATGLNDDPLAQNTVNPLRLSEGNTIMTCYDVLARLCNQFSAYLAQINGSWRFVRLNELSNATIRMRTYDFTARFKFAENVDNLYVAGAGQELQIQAGGYVRIGNAYKRAVVQLGYGTIPATVFNGDFEQWDGANFNYWTRYGGINVTRLQKAIPGVGGAPILVQDYAALFNSKAVNGKYFQANPIKVLTGDKIKLFFGVGPLVGQTSQPRRGYDMLIRIQVGKYYLRNTQTNPFGTRPGGVPITVDSAYTWADSLSTVVIPNATGGDQVNYKEVAIDMPEIPIGATGDMIIQFFGFQDPQNPTNDISPIPIDNVSISAASVSNSLPDGYLYISEQLQFYTQEPEITEILFGEFVGLDPLRPGREDTGPLQYALLNSLFTIYTNDNSSSTGWKEYGASGDYLPIGLAAAYNILKQYQQPYRFYEGSFINDSFNYMDVFNILVPGDGLFSSYAFTPLTIDINLKDNTISGTFVQIFTKNINANNSSFPHLPGTNPPPFVQNPNNPTPISGDGIFTPQFNDVFA